MWEYLNVRERVFPEHCCFCLCFVSRSLEWDCLRQRRYSSHDGLSQKISGVSRLVRARMYTRLFAGAGLRVFVFASSRMPDSPLANRHGCLRRPSLKLISHSGGFLCLRTAAADKNTASRALVILKSSNGERVFNRWISAVLWLPFNLPELARSLTRFWLSGPEWRLLILSYATHIQFFPKCHSNVSHHISHWIYCTSLDTFFLCCFCKSALTLI